MIAEVEVEAEATTMETLKLPQRCVISSSVEGAIRYQLTFFSSSLSFPVEEEFGQACKDVKVSVGKLDHEASHIQRGESQ